MIECEPGTVIPVDERVIRILESNPAFNLNFDPEYIANLAAFHGGTPLNQYFADSTGVVRRIAWFVALIDEHSKLAPPIEPAMYWEENDARVDDRALPALINHFVCPFHFGVRIVPFAALYTDNDRPLSLRLHTLDSLPADSLCFDRSTSPFSIVYCNAEAAVQQALKLDGDATGEMEFSYEFLIPVAASFREFATRLRNTPEP